MRVHKYLRSCRKRSAVIPTDMGGMHGTQLDSWIHGFVGSREHGGGGLTTLRYVRSETSKAVCCAICPITSHLPDVQRLCSRRIVLPSHGESIYNHSSVVVPYVHVSTSEPICPKSLRGIGTGMGPCQCNPLSPPHDTVHTCCDCVLLVTFGDVSRQVSKDCIRTTTPCLLFNSASDGTLSIEVRFQRLSMGTERELSSLPRVAP
ncbi:hypothetical protein BC835DRAFT_98292 [Cytidiella melzeri]|nr:hypothetical protein BC835DRAFT_98292 [Cytidiella melzeri]